MRKNMLMSVVVLHVMFRKQLWSCITVQKSSIDHGLKSCNRWQIAF